MKREDLLKEMKEYRKVWESGGELLDNIMKEFVDTDSNETEKETVNAVEE